MNHGDHRIRADRVAGVPVTHNSVSLPVPSLSSQRDSKLIARIPYLAVHNIPGHLGMDLSTTAARIVKTLDHIVPTPAAWYLGQARSLRLRFRIPEDVVVYSIILLPTDFTGFFHPLPFYCRNKPAEWLAIGHPVTLRVGSLMRGHSRSSIDPIKHVEINAAQARTGTEMDARLPAWFFFVSKKLNIKKEGYFLPSGFSFWTDRYLFLGGDLAETQSNRGRRDLRILMQSNRNPFPIVAETVVLTERITEIQASAAMVEMPVPPPNNLVE
ncbi:hypothetical protein C8R44DRAFT_934596 [Mycena epipterygia]|nr:hypothetical protein C8R44DRAFT_934596 [Mycena epipterygia]